MLCDIYVWLTKTVGVVMPGPINFDFLIDASGGGGGGSEAAPVTPPDSTNESVSAGATPAAKTFGAFTDTGSQISSYQASVTNVDGGSGSAAGTGLGPYTFSSTADGKTYILSLAARKADNSVLATAVHVVTIETAAVDPQSDVTPPAATSQAAASGATPAAKTFGAFTDPDTTISGYNAALANIVGSTSLSGSGLGAYTFSGFSDGDSFVVTLDARDSGGQVVATAVHAVSIAVAASGPSSLDPDTNTNSLNTTNQSNATTGWNAGTVLFTGPTESSQVAIGGTNASDFNISGGANGTVQLNAAGNLSATGGPSSNGTYQITLSVNNEGGSGYTTPTINIEVTPNSQSLTVLTSSDGYVVWRRNNGAWTAFDFKSSGFNLRRLDGMQALEDNASTDNVVILVRNETGSGTDTYVGTDITDDTSFVGSVDLGGTPSSPTCSHIDSINGYGMVGTNFGGGKLFYKTIASLISDGDFSSGTAVTLGWTGAGGESIQGMHTTTNGTNYVLGYSTINPGIPHISRCPGAPTGTWTEMTLPGTITQGHLSAIESVGNLIVIVGGSSPNFNSANDIHILWSPDDGSNWNANIISASFGLNDVAFNGSIWVAVGGGGKIFTSADPTTGTWTERTSGTSNRLRAVCWDSDAGEFIAAGENITVLSSSNGTSWSSESIASGPGASAFFTGAESNLGEIP